MQASVIDLDLGKFRQAQVSLQARLSVLKKHKKFPAAISWGLGYLGRLYIQTGQYDKAQQVLEEGLVIARKFYSENYTYVGWFLCYLGILCKERGSYFKAIEFLEKGQKTFEDNQIENYVYFHTLRCLGNIYREKGEYDRAKMLLNKSHNLREKTFGKGHVQTAFTLNSLGDLLLKEGDEVQAEEMIRQALHLFQEHNHPEAYMSFESLAELYIYKSKNKQLPKAHQMVVRQRAYDYLKQALDLLQAAFPKDSAHPIRIQKKLSALESLMKE